MIKDVMQWIKNESKWMNILLFIFVLWFLHVFSVSGDATNPMNNGNGFIIFSMAGIAGINILSLYTFSKKPMTYMLEETNNISKTLLMVFLFKTLVLYILLLLTWILNNAFNPILAAIFPASLMYWLSSSLSILLYSFCLFLRLSKSEYWRKNAHLPIIVLFTFSSFSIQYIQLNYQVFCDFFKEHTIWILLLFFLFYTIGYLSIRKIIQKHFKEL